MKYSENFDYMEYISRKAEGDIEGAKRALLRCLIDPGFAETPTQQSDLLQRVGGLFFEQGDTIKALEYYEKSEEAEPDSLLVVYYYAKFLAEKIKNYGLAIEKCNTVIAKAETAPFNESDDDFSSADYIQMATDLKKTCIDAMR